MVIAVSLQNNIIQYLHIYMNLYHYRSIEAALAEISNGTIQLSKREYLNDPIEGYISFYWQGDRAAWEGFFRNYVESLYAALFLGMLGNEESLENNAVLADIHQFGKDPLGHHDAAPIDGILQHVGDDFLDTDDVKAMVDFLSNGSQCDENADGKGGSSKGVYNCDGITDYEGNVPENIPKVDTDADLHTFKCNSREILTILTLLHEGAFKICNEHMKSEGVKEDKEDFYLPMEGLCREFLDAVKKTGYKDKEVHILLKVAADYLDDIREQRLIEFYKQVGFDQVIKKCENVSTEHSSDQADERAISATFYKNIHDKLSHGVDVKSIANLVSDKLKTSKTIEEARDALDLGEFINEAKNRGIQGPDIITEYDKATTKLAIQLQKEAYDNIAPEEKKLLKMAQYENGIKIRFLFPKSYMAGLKKLLYPAFFITCFSHNNTDSSMWGTYADSHRGICLVYETEVEDSEPRDDNDVSLKSTESTENVEDNKASFNATREDESVGKFPLYADPEYCGEGHRRGKANFTTEPKKVNYHGTVHERNFFDSLGSLTRRAFDQWLTSRNGERSCIHKYQSREEENVWIDRYWDTFSEAFTQKMPVWEHEGEYRILISDAFNRFYGKDRIYLEYDPEKLTGIIFGVNTSIFDKMRIINAVSEKKLNHVKFYQATYDDSKQEINIRNASYNMK